MVSHWQPVTDRQTQRNQRHTDTGPESVRLACGRLAWATKVNQGSWARHPACATITDIGHGENK